MVAKKALELAAEENGLNLDDLEYELFKETFDRAFEIFKDSLLKDFIAGDNLAHINKYNLLNPKKMETKIKVTNDGKQKAQSCEAEIELNSQSNYWGFYRVNFTGYGANEWSAKMNLIQKVDDLIVELNKLKDEVK